jgi:hypothetical protein
MDGESGFSLPHQRQPDSDFEGATPPTKPAKAIPQTRVTIIEVRLVLQY